MMSCSQCCVHQLPTDLYLEAIHFSIVVSVLELYNKVWPANVQMKRDIYGATMVTLEDVGDKDAVPAPDNDELLS